MNIAIIPARSGSKRIKNKNTKKFINEPIIIKTIKNLKKSKMFDEIYVSTDSSRIANLVKKLGVKIPFYRKKKLSNDKTITYVVIVDFLKRLKNKKIKNVTCIYPTSVFIKKQYLIKAKKLLNKNISKYIMSVTNYSHPIQRAFIINKKKIKMIFKKNMNKRTQDLSESYHDAAQFYWGQPEAWIDQLNIFDHHSCPVNIPNFRVHDIDSLEDWRRAELMFNMLQQGE